VAILTSSTLPCRTQHAWSYLTITGKIALQENRAIDAYVTNIPKEYDLTAGEIRLYIDPDSAEDYWLDLSAAGHDGTEVVVWDPYRNSDGSMVFTASGNTVTTNPFSNTFDRSDATRYESQQGFGSWTCWRPRLYLSFSSPTSLYRFRFKSTPDGNDDSPTDLSLYGSNLEAPAAPPADWGSQNLNDWTLIQWWGDQPNYTNNAWSLPFILEEPIPKYRHYLINVNNIVWNYGNSDWCIFNETELDYDVTPPKEDNYYYFFFSLASELDYLRLKLRRHAVTASGINRLYELEVRPLINEWEIPWAVNLLDMSTLRNTTTTFSGLTNMNLSNRQLNQLIDTTNSGSIPLLSGKYIGVQADLGSSFYYKSTELRLYTDSQGQDAVAFHTLASGEQSWLQHTTTWNNNGYYGTAFSGTRNVQSIKVFYGNTNSGTLRSHIKWCRAIQLINYGGVVGVVGDELELPVEYSQPERLPIYNRNTTYSYANARVLPEYTNDYVLDKTVVISPDQVTWTSIDTGVNIPEGYPLETGQFNGTAVEGGSVILTPGTISGTYISPVVEVLDPSSTVGYIYFSDENYIENSINKDLVSIGNTLQVRASNTKPMQSFLVTGLNMQSLAGYHYPYKIVAFDSNGSASTWNTGNSLNLSANTQVWGIPVNYWTFTADKYPLWQFYGFMDSTRQAAVTLGFMSGVLYDWYNFYRVRPKDGVTYSDGQDVISLTSYKSNSYFWPIFNRVLRRVFRTESEKYRDSWHMIDVVYRPAPFYERYEGSYYSESIFHLRNIYSFYGAGNTPEANTEIDYLTSLPGSTAALYAGAFKAAACIDSQGNALGYWAHASCIYPTDDILYYYIYLVNDTAIEQTFTHIQRQFNFMCEVSPQGQRGFWGIADTGIYLYEYLNGDLFETAKVESDGESSFKEITHACTDYANNLWVVDRRTEKVMRINYQDLLAGRNPIDYSRVVPGACDVYADPFDGTAYVYVINDPAFPTSDVVKMVNADEYDFINPDVVCSVPGVPLIEKSNINFIGRACYPSVPQVLANDPVWGNSGSLAWQPYINTNPSLPKGIYKQFKVTLLRKTSNSLSPSLDKIRIPIPALLDKIPWPDYKDIFVSTVTNTALLTGDYEIELFIWWPQE